ncbi:hypothetical protein OOK29_32975 [Streptomyces phaeochromogenes]|uniref:hypothetical protein n=1 Tax=Streptomyces phaeochromogenes TaxID=1923 RepID=UPI00225BEC68|nr:hypothetical protein [Streptomyces phaeochromogenes]MCX5602960.1 hypothetical protein [Streptomyces phaeochromogenes]
MPDAGTSRRRARTGMAVVVALLVLPFAVGGLAEEGAALGLVTGPLGLLLFGALCEERQPARHSMTRMTARTLTGIRSVDLNRITSVRLQTTFSYGSAYRTFLVRDAHGVRLGISSDAGRRTLRRSLERQPRAGRRSRPKVSRAARACLGDGHPGHLAVHTVLVFLAHVGIVCAYVMAVLELGGIG